MSLSRKVRAGLRLFRSRFTANSGILLYHRVAKPVRDPFQLCVSPEHFAEQIACLRELGDPLPVEEFVRRQRDGDLEKRSLCVSFDDGYLDFLENAVPILEKFEVPAVIYCVSGQLGQPFWWDRLLASLHEPEELPKTIELPNIEIPTTGLSREATFDRLYPHFRELDPDERTHQQVLLDELTGHSTSGANQRLMTADEIKTLSEHPLITIGGHTVSHTSLAGLPAPSQLDEIGGSLRSLTEISGKPVTTFSYPFGIRGRDYTSETISAARKAGLDHALAADTGIVTVKADPFSMPRLWIHDTDAASFRRKLNLWL